MGLGGISIWQLLIVLLIVVMIFGTKRLKDIGQDLGGAVKGFKKAMARRREGTGRAAPAGQAGRGIPGVRRGQAGIGAQRQRLSTGAGGPRRASRDDAAGHEG